MFSEPGDIILKLAFFLLLIINFGTSYSLFGKDLTLSYIEAAKNITMTDEELQKEFSKVDKILRPHWNLNAYQFSVDEINKYLGDDSINDEFFVSLLEFLITKNYQPLPKNIKEKTKVFNDAYSQNLDEYFEKHVPNTECRPKLFKTDYEIVVSYSSFVPYVFGSIFSTNIDSTLRKRIENFTRFKSHVYDCGYLIGQIMINSIETSLWESAVYFYKTKKISKDTLQLVYKQFENSLYTKEIFINAIKFEFWSFYLISDHVSGDFLKFNKLQKEQNPKVENYVYDPIATRKLLSQCYSNLIKAIRLGNLASDCNFLPQEVMKKFEKGIPKPKQLFELNKKNPNILSRYIASEGKYVDIYSRQLRKVKSSQESRKKTFNSL